MTNFVNKSITRLFANVTCKLQNFLDANQIQDIPCYDDIDFMRFISHDSYMQFWRNLKRGSND